VGRLVQAAAGAPDLQRGRPPPVVLPALPPAAGCAPGPGLAAAHRPLCPPRSKGLANYLAAASGAPAGAGCTCVRPCNVDSSVFSTAATPLSAVRWSRG